MSRDAEARAACAHCGLPVVSARRRRAAPPVGGSEQPLYCCAGCRIAAAVQGAEGAGPARAALVRLGLGLFFTMNVMVFSMALWSQDVYAGEFDPSEPFSRILYQLFRYLGLLFSLPVIFLLGEPVAQSVAQALRLRTISADLLILLGVIAAVAFSAVSVVRGEGHVYFDAACVILVMLTLGRWLEASGKQRTNESLDALAQLLPATVRRLRDGRVEETPRGEVQLEDLLHVRAGERFAVDGVIVSGSAEVDQQIVTGESEPVHRQAGDVVFSGTLNLHGDVNVRTTAPPGADTLARMMQLVREARLLKGAYGRLADRLAAWFVPLMCALALAVAVVHGVRSGVDRGILTGLAVVLIACPCALGLAAPMAVWTAMGRAARQGVLFRSGAALEQLAAVRAVRFDKTGTLTTGDARVSAALFGRNVDRDEALRRADACASVSGHHFAKALQSYARGAAAGASLAHDAATADQVRSVTGRGVEVRLAALHEAAYLGNAAWMRDTGQVLPEDLATELAQPVYAADSRICLGWNGRVQAVFLFRETLRPEAGEALARCRDLRLNVAVLTGDHAARGAAIAAELQAPVESELLPADKVAQLDAARRRYGCVAMIGDGVNDAPALAASDLGVALGCGADLSRDAAQVCLLTNDLLHVPWAIELSRQCVRIMRQNLFWAFAYNIVGVGLAATGRLNPVWSAIAMAVSSILVVSNSLRLNRDAPSTALEEVSVG